MIGIYEYVFIVDGEYLFGHTMLESWAAQQTDSVQWYRSGGAQIPGLPLPNWNDFLNQIKLGRITTVAVYTLDDLRWLTQTEVYEHLDQWDAMGVRFVAIKDEIDTGLDKKALRVLKSLLSLGVRNEREKALEAKMLKYKGPNWRQPELMASKKLTDEDLENVRRMWRSGMTVTDMAIRLDLSRQWIYKLVKSMKLPPRRVQ